MKTHFGVLPTISETGWLPKKEPVSMLPELFLLLTSNNHQLIPIVAGLLTTSAFFLKISKWMDGGEKD